jgi:hypothetical protein
MERRNEELIQDRYDQNYLLGNGWIKMILNPFTLSDKSWISIQ